MSWTIYDLTSGRIERTLTHCPPAMLSLQYDATTHGCIEGAYDDATQRVVDGAPVDLPLQPSPAHVWDWSALAWADNRTLDQVRAAKLAEINAAFRIASAELIAGYPIEERQTWAAQEAEVLAWALDDTTPTPYLDGIAAVRGIELADMRAKTLEAVNTFRTASQWLVGTRQALRDAIQTASTREQIQAISWPTDPQE
ncbi:hypothetical protein BH10PSE18_BH10PSE18_19140 [soil metagenome]